MTSNSYLTNKLTEYQVNINAAKSAGNSIYPILTQWGGSHLLRAGFSGSLTKETGVSCGTDADIFLSVSSECPDTPSEMYKTLFSAVSGAGYEARRQNVSIGTTVNGYKIDLVPGKRQSQWGHDHSLYKYKTSGWTKTNIDTHINTVRNSNRIHEIRLAKIWKHCHGLEIPSFYLELVVIEACRSLAIGEYTSNFLTVLEYIGNNLESTRFVDPANTNNIISDDLSTLQKRQIAQQARSSRNQECWGDILW